MGWLDPKVSPLMELPPSSGILFLVVTPTYAGITGVQYRSALPHPRVPQLVVPVVPIPEDPITFVCERTALSINPIRHVNIRIVFVWVGSLEDGTAVSHFVTDYGLSAYLAPHKGTPNRSFGVENPEVEIAPS